MELSSYISKLPTNEVSIFCSNFSFIIDILNVDVKSTIYISILPYDAILAIFDNIISINDKLQFSRTCSLYNKLRK